MPWPWPRPPTTPPSSPLLARRHGNKLDYNHISALIYAMGKILGFQTFPLAPPDQEVLQGAKH